MSETDIAEKRTPIRDAFRGIGRTASWPARQVGKGIEAVHDSKAVKAVDRALYGPVKRFCATAPASVGIGLAGGAGVGGVLLGNGETLVQKVGDAVTAVPKGIYNVANHWVNAPKYVEQTNAAMTYLREQGPEVAEELERGGHLVQASINQAQRATNDLLDAQDYLSLGGELPFDPQNALYSVRDGVRGLETAANTMEMGKDQLQETAGPAIEALQNVDLNPFLQALYNLSDNVAGDEITQTLGIAAASIVTAYLGSQYVRGFWGRRGRPGILARKVQRWGIGKFGKPEGYYEKNPEKMAGPEAIDVYDRHLVKNPEKLIALAKRAGYEMAPVVEQGEDSE